MMDRNTINRASASLARQRLGMAITTMSPILNDGAYAELHDRLRNIQREYEFMMDYMRKGIADPSRDRLYQRLLRRMHQLVSDADMVWLTANDTYMKEASGRVANRRMTPGDVRLMLEDYVSEVAMAQLTGDADKANRLHKSHFERLNLVFDTIVLSKQWTEGEAKDYEDLMVSPTVDAADAALLVSAISLSCYTHFDILKFRTLIAVYQTAADESVRQRALVGWAMSSRGNMTIYPELCTWLNEACSEPSVRKALLEMQMQVYFCLNAERDNDEIKREILPTLMKNNQFEITRSGIVEKQEDELENILHPDAADKAMEEVEKTFERMKTMQKNGSDIYFGGFSQMKRFPFFYHWAHWLMPFNIHHPALGQTREKLGNLNWLENLLANGPFCDSDKYSFALAMSGVVDRLPDSVKEMLSNAEAFGPTGEPGEFHTPAAIRQMYLQDLYRFFRLCDRRKPFRNPFGGAKESHALFWGHKALAQAMPLHDVLKLGTFLLRHDYVNALSRLLEVCRPADIDPDFLHLQAAALVRESHHEEALPLLRTAVEAAPDNMKARALMARCCMQLDRYDEAVEAYSRLHESMPEKRSHMLNLCVAMTHIGRGGEMLPELFKWSYEHPDERDVSRVLAWTLLSDGKVDQAAREYQKLLASDDLSPDDYLNAGYCRWITGEVEEALALFRTYYSMAKEKATSTVLVDMAEIFGRDSVMLFTNGLSSSSMMIMADMVEGD